ncbi:MAG: hypothetical protein ACLUDU_01460 [Butyricimonas faecihominis]
MTKDKMENVNLYEVVDGKERLVATTHISEDGHYGFLFNLHIRDFIPWEERENFRSCTFVSGAG